MHGPQSSTLTFRNVSLIHTWRPCCDSALGISEKRVGKVKDIKIAGGRLRILGKSLWLDNVRSSDK